MTVRLGLWGARHTNRGLGSQSWELARHLNPEKICVVEVPRDPYIPHLQRFPKAPIVPLTPSPPVDVMRDFLDGLDVAICCETPYWFEFYELARDLGVRTVVQANPEFYRHETEPTLPRPDLVLNPTCWRLDLMPGAVHLPHPVARDRLPYEPKSEARTFLMLGGHPTQADRQGMVLLLQAIRYVATPVRILIRSQQKLPTIPWRPRPGACRVEIDVQDRRHYWQASEGADMLIHPRRFGGQSLPALEAMSRGMPLITLDRTPDNEWPGVTVPAKVHRVLPTQAGAIEMYACEPRALAERIDGLAATPIGELSAAADAFAEARSWTRLRPVYTEMFESLKETGTWAPSTSSPHSRPTLVT